MNSVNSNAPPPLSIVMEPIHPQLLRSKSLNDISNDSQISAFASDRFINLHINNNNNSNYNHNHDINNGVNLSTTNGTNQHPTQQHGAIATPFMPIGPYIYNQTSNNVDSIQNNPLHNNHIIYGNLSFDNSARNLNNNQCSKPNGSANVFNLCNPLATMNLNGVTEQIGNLRL